jgi:TonB-dependent SusC/RagA subfamily outer membrane receptor
MKSHFIKSILVVLFSVSQISEAQKPESQIILHDSINKGEKEYPDTKVDLGYESIDHALFTGSAVVIKGSELNRIPEGNLLKQLQGLVPGLTIIGSGQAAENPVAFIRGPGNLTGSSIFFIVDGIEQSDISFINPNDVETITVLKDAAASSIFGGRSGYGVISVTTKKASSGLHVNYNSTIGYLNPGKGTADQLLNTEEHAQLQWLVYRNDKTTEVHPLYGPSTNPQPTLPSWSANTDWYKAITRPGTLQDHSLSISAGSPWGKIYFGTWYNKNTGIILHNNASKYSFVLNSEISLFKNKLRIGENFRYSKRVGTVLPNLKEESPILEGPFGMRSIVPVYIDESISGPVHLFMPGEYGGTGIAPRLGAARNSVAVLARNSDDSHIYDLFAGNIYLSLELIKGIEWRTSLGGTMSNSDKTDYSYATYENAENLLLSNYTVTGNRSEQIQVNSLMSINRQISYNKLSIISGVELWSPPGSDYYSVTRDLATGTTYQKTEQYLNPGLFLNWILSSNYSYKNKYLANFSIRTGDDEIYYSASAGWRVSEENFLKKLDWINELKFRASYGKSGNYTIKEDNSLTLNLGVDSRFLNSHLHFIVDYYSRKSKNLFASVTLPGVGGGSFLTNIGQLNNNGFEVGAKYNNSLGPFVINAGITFSNYSNNVQILNDPSFYVDYGGSRIGSMYRCMNGYPVNSFYGYQVLGLFSDDSEVSTAPQQDGAAPGFFRYENTDTLTRLFNGSAPGSKIRREYIGSTDRQVIGDPNPDFTYGIDISISYKNIDLSAFLYGSQGNDILNYTRWWTDFFSSFQGQKSKRLLYESWTESNMNTMVPKASNLSNFSTNTQLSSYYIEDGSYLRLKSLILGYNFDSKIIERLKISSFRAYVQVSNLFTLTKYTGIDPEVGGNMPGFGSDSGNYPNPKQFILGLQVRI